MPVNKITVYLAVWLLMSLITAIAYGADKIKAKKSARRTPEKTLLLLSFLLGAPGGMIGLCVFRHKTKHRYFVAVNWASLLLQIALLAVLLFL